MGKKIKTQNAVAFVLGVIVAALLWQFYLKPKYDIKTGNKEAMDILAQADVDALKQATAEVPGQVLYSTVDKEDNHQDWTANAADSNQQISVAKGNAAEEDAIKSEVKGINLDSNNILVKPHKDQPSAAAAENQKKEYDPKSRFSMIAVPAIAHVIKTQAEYDAFKANNQGPYTAKVDFSKDMIIFLESDGRLSSGFFEIDSTSADDKNLNVLYRVNIIGVSVEKDIMPYKVLKKTNKPVVLKQIK